MEIQDSRIAIHPVIKLTPLEEQKLDGVLRNYDKNLYRITTWENGKVVKVRGHGSITDRQKAEETEAAKNGRSHHGLNSVCPDAPSCTSQSSQNLTANEKQFLKKLGELLRKY